MPQIIDKEVFYKVQEMLKINRRAPAHRWSRADYILTDKIFCGKCGNKMVGESGTSRNGNKHNYYICGNNKRLKNCDKKAIRQDWIEPLVLDETRKLLGNNELIDFIAEQMRKLLKKKM